MHVWSHKREMDARVVSQEGNGCTCGLTRGKWMYMWSHKRGMDACETGKTCCMCCMLLVAIALSIWKSAIATQLVLFSA